MLKDTKAIIFDMDGVIFDSEQIYYEAFFVSAKKNGIEASPEFVKDFSGKTTTACLLILKDYLGGDEAKTQQFVKDWGEARWEILRKNGVPFKHGFIELFTYLRDAGYDLGLVTSATTEDVLVNFKNNQSSLYEHFKHMITVEKVQHPKPHPQPYLMCMELLGYSAEQCVVIEDSITGASAAVAASAKTIMINDESDLPQNLSDNIIYRAGNHADILTFLKDNGIK